MKIKPYVEKLNSSGEYKKFISENKDAFMIAGFFIIDFDTNQHTHQIDYYIPSTKKVAAFTLDKQITLQMLQAMASKKLPEKLDLKTKIDLDELKGILLDEMKNRNMTEDIKKVIAVIQNIDGKKIWNLNCVLTGMEILRAHIEDSSKSVLKMEKISMADIMRRVSPEALAEMKKKAKASGEGKDIKEAGATQKGKNKGDKGDSKNQKNQKEDGKLNKPAEKEFEDDSSDDDKDDSDSDDEELEAPETD